MKRFSFAVVLAASIAGIFAGWLYVSGLDGEQFAGISAAIAAGDTGSFGGTLYFILSSLIVPAVMSVSSLAGFGLAAVPLCLFGSAFSLSCAVSVLRTGSGGLLLPLLRCGLPNLIALPFVMLLAMRIFEQAMTRKGRGVPKRDSFGLARAFGVTAFFCLSSRLITLAVLSLVN